MKKYFVLLATFIFCGIAAHSAYAQPINAAGAKEGEECTAKGTQFEDEQFICDPELGLVCDPDHPKADDLDPTNGICVALPSAQCKCQTPGVSGSGKNGFTCNGETKVSYCEGQSASCHDVPNGTAHPNFIKDDNKEYQGKAARGIVCTDQPVAQCTCAEPNVVGSGKNGINCTLPGKPAGSGFCDDQTEACIPGGSMDEDGTTQLGEDADGAYDNLTLTGVHCGVVQPAATPTLPPPPPPPCAQAIGPDGKCNAFLTAFGAIQTTPGDFIQRIFAVLLSISGGIALLLIIRAGYIMMISAGNGEKIKEGREQLIAAIVGLLFIIFSFVILEVIGVDILGIPGFS